MGQPLLASPIFHIGTARSFRPELCNQVGIHSGSSNLPRPDLCKVRNFHLEPTSQAGIRSPYDNRNHSLAVDIRIRSLVAAGTGTAHWQACVCR